VGRHRGSPVAGEEKGLNRAIRDPDLQTAIAPPGRHRYRVPIAVPRIRVVVGAPGGLHCAEDRHRRIARRPAVWLGFLTGRVWDPNKGQYSILPEIWGTLYSSVLALILGTAFGVAAAVFLAEGFVSEYVFALLKIFKVQFHPGLGQATRANGQLAAQPD